MTSAKSVSSVTMRQQIPLKLIMYSFLQQGRALPQASVLFLRGCWAEGGLLLLGPGWEALVEGRGVSVVLEFTVTHTLVL